MVFRPGPVFTQLLLADEINRTPPKTQAALLEAMGEGQVSMDGVTRPLPQAIHRAGDRQPDRVRGHLRAARRPSSTGSLCGCGLGYLTTGDEVAMLQRRLDRQRRECHSATA